MKITVEGITGEGKSVVAVTIAQALRKEGFAVSFTDIDGPEELMSRNLEEKRAHLVARGTMIDVETKQFPRRSKDRLNRDNRDPGLPT